MSDIDIGERLRVTDEAPEAVWKRLNASQAGLGNLAKQAFALGFKEVEIPQFVDVDPYAKMTPPTKEVVPELDDNNLRMVISREASASDQVAERYRPSSVGGGQGNA